MLSGAFKGHGHGKREERGSTMGISVGGVRGDAGWLETLGLANLAGKDQKYFSLYREKNFWAQGSVSANRYQQARVGLQAHDIDVGHATSVMLTRLGCVGVGVDVDESSCRHGPGRPTRA